MADPPSYEDSISSCRTKRLHVDGDSKEVKILNVRDEVSSSRSQHVAVLVSKLLPEIRERAREGMSRSTFLLIPSDQAPRSAKGEIVGLPEDDRPTLIQLDGRYDKTEFWMQAEALLLLQEQLWTAVAGAMPRTEAEQLPPPTSPGQSKSSRFGRKSKKEPDPTTTTSVASKPPVTVEVQLDDIHFRSETEYGLYETVSARAVLVVVDVR